MENGKAGRAGERVSAHSGSVQSDGGCCEVVMVSDRKGPALLGSARRLLCCVSACMAKWEEGRKKAPMSPFAAVR